MTVAPAFAAVAHRYAQAHFGEVTSRRFVALMGDAVATNVFLLGFAWQKGWIPLERASLLRAIELNAVAVEQNKAAFEWGRRAAHDLEATMKAVVPANVIQLVKKPSLRLHTHCNAGGLACVEWGTALGIVRALHERGAVESVFAVALVALTRAAGQQGRSASFRCVPGSSARRPPAAGQPLRQGQSTRQSCTSCALGRRMAPAWRPLPARAGGLHRPQT